MPKLVFFYDYAHPVSGLAETVLGRVAGKSVTVERLPCPVEWGDLGPEAWVTRCTRAQRLARELGEELVVPDLPSRGHKAFELAFLAAARGCFQPVHDAIFHSHFREGRDIGRIDELVRIAAAAGLDPSEAKAVLDVDTYTEDLREWSDRAASLGVSSTPTIVHGSERFEEIDAVLEASRIARESDLV